jgi:DNA-binding NtrC family response regulator
MIATIERLICEIAITAARGNIQAAADALGIRRTTLHMRLKRYKIDVNREPRPVQEADHLRIKPPGFGKCDGITVLKCKMCFDALEKHGWNRSKAARECGVSTRYMRYMVHTLRFAGYQVPSVDSNGRIIV